jgi:translation initiation factor 2 subunit 2
MSEEELETKKSKDAGDEDDADVAALLDLTSKKKKKKKSSKKGEDDDKEKKEGKESATAALSPSSGEEILVSQQRDRLIAQDMAQISQYLRQTTDTELAEEAKVAADEEDDDDNAPALDSKQVALDLDDDRRGNYSYMEMLDRVVELLQANNPDLVDKKRTRMKPPQLQPLTSKKSLWVNFQEICAGMQRDPLHVYSFFMTELGTEGNFDGNERLIIRGKYPPKVIESLLRKYISDYVTCVMCRSANTELSKDSSTRLYFLNCKECGSSRSVLPIKSGYHATSRADRRAARSKN